MSDNSNPVDLPYTKNIQNMLSAYFDQLDMPYLILRNRESLPERSGFDIDILLDEQGRKTAIKICETVAKNHGIVAVHNNKRIACFDLQYDITTQRNWALIDLQTIYAFGQTQYTVQDMLKMPEGERDTLIQNVQDARKGRTSKDVQRKLGITPYAKPKDIPLSKLQKIKRVILKHGFFIHMHAMPFIVISGPDGVGKTTLLTNILRLFDSLPLKTANFHHTGLGKNKSKKATQNQDIKEEEMSLIRRLRRRYTPVFIKKIYGAITGETRYAMQINTEIVKNFYSSTLTFSDRYIYDREIKMRMLPDKMRISKITTRINSYLMRKPSILIIPTDKPDAIFTRKQELQIDEIKTYYDELKNIIQNRKFPCIHYVDIAGKTPEDLGIETTKMILQSLSPVLFNAIGTYEKELKRR